MKLRIKTIVAACALAMVAGQAGAIDYTLAAKAYTKTLPDGSTVPMWGYVIDPDNDNSGRGDCYETTPVANRLTCVDALAPPTGVVGPRLTIPPTDSTFRIFLTNALPEPTSIVIPGQEMPHSALLNGVPDNGPTWNDGSRGSRGADLSKKLRSYGREANAGGGRRAFVWRNSRNNPITETGTLIYHTGTWPQKQLYMGLYGLVTKDAAPGVVYDLDPVNTGDEVTYGSDTTLFYSDIDPAFNAAVAAGTLETAIDRHPSWFLINGEPYVAGATSDLTGLATNQSNLLRFASAASEKHVPVLQGLYGTIHGEDGMQYTWQDGATGVATPAPIQQYSIGLPPLKTKDVIINPTTMGRYAVYDGNGYMTNPSDPGNEDPTDIDTLGGMLRFFDIAQGADQPPVTVADQAIINLPEITVDTVLPVTMSVPVDVLANDSDPEGAALVLLGTQETFVDGNLTIDLICTAGDVACTATATASDVWTSPVATDLTYSVSDGTASTPGTVTVNVVENLAPSVVDDAVAADSDPGNPTMFNLLDNDSDPENDLLTITLGGEAIQGTLDCPDLTDGNCTYTPPAGLDPLTLPLIETFTYTVSDGINPDAGPATVTITVDLANGAPTAVDDVYQTQVDVMLSEAAPGVLGNDTDPNPADVLSAVLDTGPSNAAAFVLNADGSFDYTPAAGYVGPDSFTYLANDGNNNSATPATVSITVNPNNVAPVATADIYEVNEDAVLDVVAPGVLDNDIDADLDPLTAVLVTGPSNARPDPGSFVLNADGSFHYEPGINFNGTDSFTYVANDGTVDSTEVTVTINVIPQNDAPVVNNDVFYLQNAINMVTDGEGQPLTVTFDFPAPGVLANDFDDTAMTATEVNDPDNVTPSLTADGAASVDITNNAVGTLASLEYTATDTSNFVSDIATADFVRLVTVTMSEYRLNEDTNPANDDWRIRGNVDTTVVPAGSQVHAFLVSPGGNEQEIVSNAAGGNSGVVLNNGSFRLYTNNLGPLAHVGAEETIRVEVRDEFGELIPDAVYYNVPVYILP